MKYIRQLGIILLFSLAGDVCHGLLPFPIPASIYGMVLLLLALTCKLVKVEDVKQTGDFLVSLLPLLQPDGTLLVRCYGVQGACTLYDDDGETTAYKNGCHALLHFSFVRDEQGLHGTCTVEEHGWQTAYTRVVFQ